MSERCEVCKYWQRNVVRDTNRGSCHRFPPVVVSDGIFGGTTQEHPEVFAYHRCGEFVNYA